MQIIKSKADLWQVSIDLVGGGYQYLGVGGLDLTERIKASLVRWLADVGHRRGFRYGDDWAPFFAGFNLTDVANDLGDQIENGGMQFVVIPQQGADDLIYPVDSEEAISEAQTAMIEAGIEEADVWFTCSTFEEVCEGEANSVKLSLVLVAKEGREACSI